MKKLALCVLAVLAGAVSTSAMAKDLKQNKQAPAVSATQMTDSKMDKVAASTFSGANDNGRLGSGIDGVSR
jgi:opacity protein-like surface antigen